MNGLPSSSPSPLRTETRASDILVGRKTFLVPSERISSSSYGLGSDILSAYISGGTYKLQGHKFCVYGNERARSRDLILS